jgi:hypothetical protein
MLGLLQCATLLLLLLLQYNHPHEPATWLAAGLVLEDRSCQKPLAERAQHDSNC